MISNLNILFLLMTFMSTIFSISSSSWFGSWMGLEINMLSFIPLITNSKNILCNESALKYFIIQTLASSFFLAICLMNSMFNLMMTELTLSTFNSLILSTPLILKLGAAPFQSWFLSVLEGLPWMKYFILMTWQKIAPLFLMSYFLKNINLIMFWAIFSLFIGTILGLNQTSLKKILACSSVNHMGWMISSLIMNKFFLLFYLALYSLLNYVVILFLLNNVNSLSQIMSIENPLMFSISLLSLGGLPPLLGFLPKWLILQNLMFNSFILLSFIMIMLALITLFLYTRIILTNLILNSSKSKLSWTPNMNLNNFNVIIVAINCSTLILLNFF